VNREEKRAAILASDLPREPVEVPWIEDKLYVRGLTAGEKDAWYSRNMPGGEFVWTANMTAELVVRTLVDEDGQRIFEDEDVAALGAKDAETMGRLFDISMRLSGLSEEGVEEIRGDFTGARSGATSSG
jgi:hypothetical protein